MIDQGEEERQMQVQVCQVAWWVLASGPGSLESSGESVLPFWESLVL